MVVPPKRAYCAPGSSYCRDTAAEISRRHLRANGQVALLRRRAERWPRPVQDGDNRAYRQCLPPEYHAVGLDDEAFRMSFWKSLFGGKPESEPGGETGEPVEYKGFVIRAAPFKSEGRYQTAGVITKDVAGERKEHRFIRADSHATLEQAAAFSLDKARQIIDLQGDRLFN
jgi:hypothetical protein